METCILKKITLVLDLKNELFPYYVCQIDCSTYISGVPIKSVCIL